LKDDDDPEIIRKIFLKVIKNQEVKEFLHPQANLFLQEMGLKMNFLSLDTFQNDEPITTTKNSHLIRSTVGIKKTKE
jgi:hypothetical protein